MTAKKKPKPQARERKRLRREGELRRRAQRARTIAEEAAVRLEAAHEEMAPLQQRLGVAAADGTVLRGPLAVLDTKARTFRRHSSLWQMHCQNPRLITERHLAAAQRYGSDYEVAFGGAKPSAAAARVDGATAPEIAAIVLEAVRRVNAAKRALGPLGDAVTAVVLFGWSIERLSQWRGIPHQKMCGYLVAGLDLLVSWYWPQPMRRDGPEAPPVADARVTDIPQERLGRWDRSPELAEAEISPAWIGP